MNITLMAPNAVKLTECNFDSNVTIPILDSQISPEEVQLQIKQLKPDKACGPDGVPPGILKMLPVQWILTLTTLFNTVFSQGRYPVEWSRAKLIAIFKKGNKKDVKNYRGISMMNSVGKLCDMVLYSRLKQWFTPCRDQAGSQEKRGCMEHIVSLRLLCDMARRKKTKIICDIHRLYTGI